jgi:hypothetical protein
MKAVFAGVLALCLVAAAPAHAADDPDTQARSFFAVGKYQQALDIYGKLYAESLHPTYLRNIARCQQLMGEPDLAINSFREYLRKSKPAVSAEERAEVNGFIKEMEALKQKRQAERASQAPPVARSKAPVEVPSSELVDRPEPAPPRQRESASHNGLAFGLVLGGVAMAAGGSVLMVVMSSKANEARLRRDTVAYDGTKGPWMLGLGGVIGGALAMTGGLVLFLADGGDETRTAAVRIDPWIGRHGAGLVVGAGW